MMSRNMVQLRFRLALVVYTHARTRAHIQSLSFLSLSFSFTHSRTQSFSHASSYSSVYLPFLLSCLCLLPSSASYTMPLRPLSSLSHSFPIITLPLYTFCHHFFRALLSVHLLASVFSLLPGGAISNTGIRGQALNISHLVMPQGGHHPGFVVLTH